MKKTILTLITLVFSSSVFSSSQCFIAKENNKIVKEEGDCETRYAPASTFKIPLSLMGYDAGIFQDETHPEWERGKYEYHHNACKGSHDPKTWMRDSCVWYSQILTQKLGEQKFVAYIKKFDYGNQDLSGDKGKNNGLTHAWLSSSLQISPVEQTDFLQKLNDKKLQVSDNAYAMTQKIMFIQEFSAGWKIYGKTGSGVLPIPERTAKTDIQHGWFVGWIEKNGRKIVFANHIADDKKEDVHASFRARNEALIKLWYLVNDLEK